MSEITTGAEDDVTQMTMKLADRVARLGTETAFAVSAEAAAFAQKGNEVFPFHLGDMNLLTPENIMEAAERAMRDGKTGYCPNGGIPQLREALAAEVSHTHGIDYSAENVAVQPGGKPVIEKFLLTLMNPGNEVLYPNPGFPIYESQIEFHGGVAKPYGFIPGKTNFLLDFEAIEAAITPRTRLLIYNNQHNPTGAESPPEELEALAELALAHDLYVLSDEAYWDIRYSGTSRSIASLPGMAERTVILYTFSKKFAMTGWRLGGAIGPKEVIAVIATLNVNEESCTNHFVQYAGVEALTGDQSGAQEILRVLQERRDVAVRAINDIAGITCYSPDATFYLFPDVTRAMERTGLTDYADFRVGALDATGCSFCTRLHFGRELPGEDRRYIRIAYSGIDADRIATGLSRLKAFVEGRSQ
jgi:aspartate/methionine/tyrosine aminotransferase